MKATLGTLHLRHVEGEGVADDIDDGIGLRFMDLAGDLHTDHAEGNLLRCDGSVKDYGPDTSGPVKVIERMPVLTVAIIGDQGRGIGRYIFRRHFIIRRHP
jgi:hypothetical protein